MLSRSTTFDDVANGQLRPLSWALRMSFDKSFDSNVEFFTLDQSILNGTDVLAPSDNNVIQEWDKYDYRDYSNRVMSLEWQREEDFPYNVSMAMADVKVNNTDDYFTPNGGSVIDEYILPKRPMRILSGFNGERLPSFVGMTEKMPVVDEGSKQASFHALDFLSYLFERPLNQTVIYEDLRTDEVIDELFQLFGLTSNQYVLEPGFNRIPFVWFPIGTKLGEALRQLVQAEMGSLYMDELGIIRFVNKNSRSTTPVYFFDESNTHDIQISREDDIINVVEVKANVREVQNTQAIYNLTDDGSAEDNLIPANTTLGLFYKFDDPVTSVADIDYFIANSQSDGNGVDLTGNVSIDSIDVFDTAIQINWDNNSSTPAYITDLTIYGTPARIVRQIDYRDQNDASVAQFDEKILSVENDYIQSVSAAESMASIILDYYSEYGGVITIETKANPALQIGDCINVSTRTAVGEYIVTKIVNKIDGYKFSQSIVAKVNRARTFFILDQSILNGTDVLSP